MKVLKRIMQQRDDAIAQRDDITLQRDAAWSQIKEMGDVLKTACDDYADLIKLVRNMDAAIKKDTDARVAIARLECALPDVKAIKSSYASLASRFEAVKISLGQKNDKENEDNDA